jgi:hypothetical protein
MQCKCKKQNFQKILEFAHNNDITIVYPAIQPKHYNRYTELSLSNLNIIIKNKPGYELFEIRQVTSRRNDG